MPEEKEYVPRNLVLPELIKMYGHLFDKYEVDEEIYYLEKFPPIPDKESTRIVLLANSVILLGTDSANTNNLWSFNPKLHYSGPMLEAIATEAIPREVKSGEMYDGDLKYKYEVFPYNNPREVAQVFTTLSIKNTLYQADEIVKKCCIKRNRYI